MTPTPTPTPIPEPDWMPTHATADGCRRSAALLDRLSGHADGVAGELAGSDRVEAQLDARDARILAAWLRGRADTLEWLADGPVSSGVFRPSGSNPEHGTVAALLERTAELVDGCAGLRILAARIRGGA